MNSTSTTFYIIYSNIAPTMFTNLSLHLSMYLIIAPTTFVAPNYKGYKSYTTGNVSLSLRRESHLPFYLSLIFSFHISPHFPTFSHIF